jgi:hypothetical protein
MFTEVVCQLLLLEGISGVWTGHKSKGNQGGVDQSFLECIE